MNDQQRDGESPCCGGGDCCQPGGGGEGKRSNRWRTLVFTAVILLAGVVTAYSLFWRNRGEVSSSCCATASAGCATPCGTVTPIAGLDDRLEGADFAIAVFLPAGCAFPQHVADVIHGVITDLGANGTHVRMLYFSPADAAFAKAADRYKITSCPTILVSTKTDKAVLAQEAISRDSILNIYKRSQKADQTAPTSATGQAR